VEGLDQDCIEYEDDRYCLEGDAPEVDEDA
jgi:hypothetical protein